MPKRDLVVGLFPGLHARPAAVFVNAAKTTGFPISITCQDGRTADALSILSVLALDLRHGDKITLVADEPDAVAALDTLTQVLTGEL